ncbi:MAG: NUDIX hydrolase [Chloroflexi bacterium]|nr:NUDIX hydrolase [Chloroflexota bacterium]
MTSPNRSLLAAWLRAIPQSRHDPCPLHELPGGDVIGQGLALLLQTWGAVEFSEAGLRATSQPAYYFLHSLAAWAEDAGEVILDWSEQYGARSDAGLRHGVSLVYLLESERLARNPAAKPIRFTPVAQILIVQAGNPPRFLGQWDGPAGAYQLIGGRQRIDRDQIESIRDTAIREMEEELGGQVNYQRGDFEIVFLAEFSGDKRISPSFGALTSYHFTFFHILDMKPIVLGSQDRWLTRDELLAGITHDGKTVRGNHIPQLERLLGYSINELPSSFT